MDLKIEYISALAVAQRSVGSAGIEQYFGFAANIAAATGDRAALDKVNIDEMMDEYGEMKGVPPSVVVTTEDANKQRAARAQAQAQAEAAMQAQQMAETAKTVGDINTERGGMMDKLKEGGALEAMTQGLSS